MRFFVSKKKKKEKPSLSLCFQAAELSPNRSVDWFLVFYFTLLVGVFLLWLIFVDYPENGQVATSDPTRNNDIFALRGSFRRADNIYTFYSNAALLVFLGFGLFWALPRRITWSALGINFMIGAYVMIVVILLNGFFLWASDHHFGKILITPTVMLDALYGAAACMIAYGAVVGQLDPIGILIFATIQVILYAINCYLSYGPIDAREFGRAGTVFTFGSCFGIATAWSISYWHPEAESVKEQKPSYFSSVMAFIGAVIIFICFPAFNTSLSIWWNVDGALNDGVLDGPFAGQQYRSLMNTISSEMGSAAAGFALSQIFRGKFRIPDLLRTVIAGGVAMSSAHNIIIQPWAAFIIGGISGVLCQVSLYWAQPFLLRVVRCNDVSHVFSTFFLPSALSALTGMIALGIYVDGDEADPTNFGGQPYAALFDRQETAIRNFGAWMLSIMFGLTAGLICGIFVNAIKKLSPPPAGNERLTDDIGWRVGVDE
jgi:ammonium transporter Rh